MWTVLAETSLAGPNWAGQIPAWAELRNSKRESRLSGLTMALFVLFAASTGARIVAANLVVTDRLFVAVAGSVPSDKLQLGELLFLLTLDIAREILNGGLRGGALLLSRGDGRLFFFLFIPSIVFREWQRRTLALRHLQEEQVAQTLVFNSLHHGLEQLEGFLLILDQRVLLAITTEADAFL